MDKNLGWNFEHTYSELPECFFSKAAPTAVRDQTLVAFNTLLAQEMGLDVEALKQPKAAALFVGNELPPNSKPIAQAYAGHQFGNFTMLGDGRAILLGEHITPLGQRIDVQLKGAGRTTYSRSGDGRAALGPMLREFIISEAMHGLGIPTTRSLAVATTGENVVRERILPGGILTRIASSHIRVGTFEFAAARDDLASLAALTLYALERHFPDFPEDVPPAYTLLLRVVEAQAQLIARWMSVGFIHGVMNTDNMAISGETIDYGPCAFMDHYHPNTVFSAIDQQGRYAFANQAQIGLWNLERFAETLLPILHEDEQEAVELAQNALDSFAEIFNSTWLLKMRSRLGLASAHEQDQALIRELLGIMQQHEWDFHNTFRALLAFSTPRGKNATGEDTAATFETKPTADLNPLVKHGSSNAIEFSKSEFQQWLARWHERLALQELGTDEVESLMTKSNPTVIARNHRVEAALKAAEQGDLAPLHNLWALLRNPFGTSAEHQNYSMPPAPQERVLNTFCGT